MNRKLISEAISNIDDTYIAETLSLPVANADRAPERTIKMSKYEAKRNGVRSRRVFSLILAACLVFAFAITAYAFNFLGIREMLQRKGQELPEEAYGYIQEHDLSIDSKVWRCDVTESLCDDKNICITVTVTTPGEYILAPTDATPESTVRVIGIDGDQTLEEYAKAEKKKLLFVGMDIEERESLGIAHTSQTFESTSPQEMTILYQAQKTASAPIQEVICVVTGVEETAVRSHYMGITLEEAPSDGSMTYVPVDPDAIPGLTVGNATVTQTPLGISIRIKETMTDEDAFYNIMKVEFDGLEYGVGGSVLEDDGNWYLAVSGCTGTVGDELTVRYYDWNSELIGSIVFELQ